VTYSAWFELHADDEIARHPTAIRVYAHLLRNESIFFAPQDVKAWLLADTLKTHPDTVNAAIKLLVTRGYVIEHGRGMNNVRRLTIVRNRVTCHPD